MSASSQRRASRLKTIAALLALAVVLAVPRAAHAGPPTPNILFIIMDDVGMDQMRTFGYGGQDPPSTPTIQQIADAGVRFSNAWSMPACSTSRALLFTGRFPLRTNVYGALGPGDLANSQVSPFEMTVPTLLKMRGYRSALFGKFHLGLQSHNPYGQAMPRSVGWDYYAGWLDETGDPPSIDTTAGGVAPEGTWSCGFVPGSGDHSPSNPNVSGADTGACYAADDTCQVMTTSAGIPPGRTCRDSGGIFVPGGVCQSPRPAGIDFSRMSGHYVSPYVIDHEDGTVEMVPSTDIRARSFRGSVPVDAAIEWIARQPRNTPWMATVSFASAHTPLMQPPPSLLASGAAATSGLDCTDPLAERVLMNQMTEAMDAEVGRLLVATGLAVRNAQGGLDYTPGNTDTMVVIVGDNGSFGTTVKPPFDPSRSKGTAYQTGVWVPLVVAGPLVNQPNRTVSHMVNLADLYQLFGEIAGIDVPASVPRTIDAAAMLPYLLNPAQASIRAWNFTQVGPNLQANGAINGPCAFPSSCSQIPVSKSVCEDNGGVWWGQGSQVPGLPPEGLKLCCEVNVWIAQHPESGLTPISIQPLSALAIRNDRYKIVRNSTQLNDPAYTACVATTSDEFYEIDEAVPTPRLDRAELDLKTLPSLTPDQQANYDALSAQLDRLLTSQAACPGDGNLDGKVDQQDVADWNTYAALAQGQSSWYDINQDGRTDQADLAIIQNNLGADCQTLCTGCTGNPPASGWICVRGGWVPPGHPLASSCVVTGGTSPPSTPAATCGGCTGAAPGSDWVCVNGGWVPPGHPLAGSCPGGTSPPPAATCGGCTGTAPASGWVCVNGGWVPPGHPLAGSCPGGTSPPPAATCGGCTGAAPGAGWVCVNGGWVPPGHPLAAPCETRPSAQRVPILHWPSPAPIPAGASLDATRLNAEADVPGSFTYTPSAGTLLTPGTHTLWVSFMPDDGATYAAAAASVSCVVRPVRSDVTGDGIPDLVVRDPDTGSVDVWVFDGTRAVRAGNVGTEPDGAWQIAATGDFNGDGNVDVVWRHATTGQNRVWFLRGGTYLGAAAIDGWEDPAWRIVDAADMNGDGQDDLIWENSAAGQRGICLMRGTTAIGSAALESPPQEDGEPDPSWTIVGADDFNADGWSDMVWRDASTGRLRVQFADGAARFRSDWLPELPDSRWTVVLIADFNRDGYPDVFWRDDRTGATGVWYWFGPARPAAPPPLARGPLPTR